MPRSARKGYEKQQFAFEAQASNRVRQVAAELHLFPGDLSVEVWKWS